MKDAWNIRLRRKSKRHSPDRFDPCLAGTQKSSNKGKGKDTASPTDTNDPTTEGQNDIESSPEKLTEKEGNDSDGNSCNSSEGVPIPENIGRNKELIPIKLHLENINQCSVCLTTVQDGNIFPFEFTHARICSECNEKDPPPMDITAVTKYISYRSSSNVRKCLVCGSKLDIASHRFGDYRFCSACVAEGECPCPLCSSLKTASLRKLQQVWQYKLANSSQHSFIDSDFSTRNQILLYFRCQKVPKTMGELLHAFTTLTTKKDHGNILCANSAYMKVSDIHAFGLMKCHNARNADRPTFFQWITRSGKKRMLSGRTMSFAQELLNNQDTICIPHSCSMTDFRIQVQQRILACRDLIEGIFTFRFIQTFIDLVPDKPTTCSWTSFVIDLKQKEMFYFDRKKDVAKNVLSILNTELKEEWNQPDRNETEKASYKEINLGSMATFALPMFGDNQKYIWDSGVASILHSWTMTSPDVFGTDEKFTAGAVRVLDVFDLFDEDHVEGFRQLVLFWLLCNDMNMHLYINFTKKY